MSDDLIKSRLGYTYDLKDALRHNPTIIQAGDDICAVALTRIEALEAENARLREALKPFSKEAGWWLSKGYTASEPPVEGFEDYQGVMTCGDLFNARATLQDKEITHLRQM